MHFVFSAWHSCFSCKNRSTFRCLGCPYAVCKKCVSAEFTVVKGVQGLCIDCLEIVKIIELNLDHDLERVSVITLICRIFTKFILIYVNQYYIGSSGTGLGSLSAKVSGSSLKNVVSILTDEIYLFSAEENRFG
jgi:predicted membrane protein